MYLCSYVEAASGETGQDVDPEDSDFHVPYHFFFVGPFLAPLGRLFGGVFPDFSIFCSILGPIFGSVLEPKTGPQNRALIGFLL